MVISCTLQLRITLLDQLSCRKWNRAVGEMSNVSWGGSAEFKWKPCRWAGRAVKRVTHPQPNKKLLCSGAHLPLLTAFPCALWNLQSDMKNGASLWERSHRLNGTRSFLLGDLASTFLGDDPAVCHTEAAWSMGVMVAGDADGLVPSSRLCIVIVTSGSPGSMSHCAPWHAQSVGQ